MDGYSKRYQIAPHHHQVEYSILSAMSQNSPPSKSSFFLPPHLPENGIPVPSQSSQHTGHFFETDSISLYQNVKFS